jgi:hypothetical protein
LQGLAGRRGRSRRARSQALMPAKHEQLIKSGLVKIEPQWGRASGGRVSVKVF